MAPADGNDGNHSSVSSEGKLWQYNFRTNFEVLPVTYVFGSVDSPLITILITGFCENEEEILQASSGDTDSHSSSSPPASSDDATRRISQDESVSDDECNMYFYDTAAARQMNACSGDESSPTSSGVRK